MRNVYSRFLWVLLAGSASILPIAPVQAAAQTPHVNDADTAGVRSDIQKALRNKRFSDVQVNTQGSAVVLSGAVRLLADKIDAEKDAQKRSQTLRVENDIQVQAPENINDAALREKLAKKLTYDRVGYGTTAFNYITLEIHHGVATVAGLVVLPEDKSVAIADIVNTLGVTGLVDNLQVAPVSPNDDRIRRDELRAVYGASQLNRYALDPAKQIRISVLNGHVTLYGVVDTQGDRDVAGLRANGVPGVFSVDNKLEVTGQQPGR